jgi:cytochrome c biogenesis protein
MLGVVMSYVSHSQVWALVQGDCFYIGGKTNRSQVLFEREMLQILEELNQVKNPPVGSFDRDAIATS